MQIDMCAFQSLLDTGFAVAMWMLAIFESILGMPNSVTMVACSDDDAEGLCTSGSQVPCLRVQLAVRAVAGTPGARFYFHLAVNEILEFQQSYFHSS